MVSWYLMKMYNRKDNTFTSSKELVLAPAIEEEKGFKYNVSKALLQAKQSKPPINVLIHYGMDLRSRKAQMLFKKAFQPTRMIMVVVLHRTA